jgi:voltage-gated potassium channel
LGIWATQEIGNGTVNIQAANAVLFIVFFVELCILTYLVDDRATYLTSNWMNNLKIISSVPTILGYTEFNGFARLFRLIIVANLFIHSSFKLRRLLQMDSLGPALIASIIIIVMFSFVITALDPNITTFGEGLWWAWVTVSTVGYGDIVPGSIAGKAIGSIFMFIGLGLTSLLTAAIARAMIKEPNNEKKVAILHQDIRRIEAKLDKLAKAIDSKISDDSKKE